MTAAFGFTTTRAPGGTVHAIQQQVPLRLSRSGTYLTAPTVCGVVPGLFWWFGPAETVTCRRCLATTARRAGAC